MQEQVAVLLRRPPAWNALRQVRDLESWLLATEALHQWGGPAWERWRAATVAELLPHQRQDGELRGSWDPPGPAAGTGERIRATALCALVLEADRRYARVLESPPPAGTGASSSR